MKASRGSGSRVVSSPGYHRTIRAAAVRPAMKASQGSGGRAVSSPGYQLDQGIDGPAPEWDIVTP
jgi:hypothetical protein